MVLATALKNVRPKVVQVLDLVQADTVFAVLVSIFKRNHNSKLM